MQRTEINKFNLHLTSGLKFLLFNTFIQVSTKINVSRLSTASLGKFTEKLVSTCLCAIFEHTPVGAKT